METSHICIKYDKYVYTISLGAVYSYRTDLFLRAPMSASRLKIRYITIAVTKRSV